MPSREGSRYMFCSGIRDDSGRLFLTEREPFGYRELPDTRRHVVADGDTLFSIAGRYFAPLERACGYWWAVADFQPEPIIDPTAPLVPGATVFVPSVRVLTDVILGRRR